MHKRLSRPDNHNCYEVDHRYSSASGLHFPYFIVLTALRWIPGFTCLYGTYMDTFEYL